MSMFDYLKEFENEYTTMTICPHCGQPITKNSLILKDKKVYHVLCAGSGYGPLEIPYEDMEKLKPIRRGIMIFSA